jgi:hypothetical protein
VPSELAPLDLLDQLRIYELMNEAPPGELVRMASQNFFRLMGVCSHQLKPETLDLILSESLMLESEDSLLDFLKGEIDEVSVDLLRHVELSCLSKRKFQEFMALLSLETLTPGIWASIQSIRPKREGTSESHEFVLMFPFRGGYFDGIFAHLNRMTGGNCARRGTIHINGTNTYDGDLSVLFGDNDWSGYNYWEHSDVLNGWFRVDFKDRRVSVTHYAIHNSLTWNREQDFLRTWSLEGSNVDSDSDSNWTKIDYRRKDESLHGASKRQALFECNGDNNHAFRYIRLVQRGTSHDPKSYSFSISHLELFGTLIRAR